MSAQSAYLILQTYAEDWDADPEPMLEEGGFLSAKGAEARIAEIVAQELGDCHKRYDEQRTRHEQHNSDTQKDYDKAVASHKVLLAAGLASPADALNFPHVHTGAFEDFDRWFRDPMNRTSYAYSVKEISLR